MSIPEHLAVDSQNLRGQEKRASFAQLHVLLGAGKLWKTQIQPGLKQVDGA